MTHEELLKKTGNTLPELFSFDGDFEKDNRGLLEFTRALMDEVTPDQAKAARETYEKNLGHTSNPERLSSDKVMEALRDRTVKVDVPFLLGWEKK